MSFMSWTKEDMRIYWFKIPSVDGGIASKAKAPYEHIGVAPGWLYEKGNTQHMIPYRGGGSNTETWLGIKKDNGDELVHCLNPQCKRYVIRDDENPFSADYEDSGLPAFYLFGAGKDAPPRLMTYGEIIGYCYDWADVLREFPGKSGLEVDVIINHLKTQADVLKIYESQIGCR